MAEIYFRFFFKKSLIQSYRLKLFNGMYIHLFINKFFFSYLGCWQMEQDIVNGFFLSITFYCWQDLCNQDLCDQLTPFLTDNYFIISILEVLLSLNVMISVCFVERENASVIFCWEPHLFLQLVVLIIRLLLGSLQNHKKKWHRFWLHLHHTIIFMSNIKISASVKINWSVDLNSKCHDCSIKKRSKVLWL